MIRSAISKTIRSMITTIINPFDGLLSRYFVNLDPVLNSYYEMAQPITFTGDFEIEVEFSTTLSNAGNVILGNTSSIASAIFVNELDNHRIQTRINNVSITGTTTVNDGLLHKVKIERVGTTFKLYVDGILEGTNTVTTNNVLFNLIGRYTVDTNFFEGIIANAKFTDKSGASDVVTTFKLDQATANTEYSQENVFGSEEVVNGDFATDSDWDLDSGWAIANGKATNTGVSYTYIKQDGGLTLGSNISITFEIKDYTSGSVRFNNNVDPISQNFIGDGYHTILVSNLLSSNLRFQADLFDGSIDNISVKEITNAVEYKNIPQSARDLYTLDGTTWTDAAGNTIEVAS